MKTPLLSSPKSPLLAALLVTLAACNLVDPAADANEANFGAALRTYLARRGDLCVGRSQWPVVVTREEAAQVSRNSVQLPVLEKAGLVASTQVEAEIPGEDGQPARRTQARRYDLTEKGRQFYLPRPPRTNANGTTAADHDFCAAKLSLRKVVRWDPPAAGREGTHTSVTYTYDIAPAPWTADPDVRRAFPVIDRMVRGAGTIELKEAMVLTPAGWQAKDL